MSDLHTNYTSNNPDNKHIQLINQHTYRDYVNIEDEYGSSDDYVIYELERYYDYD